MSLGLDALNKLQRMRAETAAARGTATAPSSYHGRPQTNRLLVAASIVSLGVATAALFLARGRSPSAPIAAGASVQVPAPAPVQAAPADTAPAAQPVAALPLTPPTVIVPTIAPPPNPLVASFVTRATIGGVDDGKDGQRPLVILNDSIYHLDDVVNFVLGVRLVAIQSNRLTFQDRRGVRYVRNLLPL